MSSTPAQTLDPPRGRLRRRHGPALRHRRRSGKRAAERKLRARYDPVILGGNDASGVPTELFPGRIDEVMLYARALSAAEIGQLAAGALFPGGATDAAAD